MFSRKIRLVAIPSGFYTFGFYNVWLRKILIWFGTLGQLAELQLTARNWVFATNSVFPCPKTLQPRCGKPWYFKPWILCEQIFQVWKYQMFPPTCINFQRYRIRTFEFVAKTQLLTIRWLYNIPVSDWT